MSTLAGRDHVRPLKMRTSPALSTAAQKVWLGHETEEIAGNVPWYRSIGKT